MFKKVRYLLVLILLVAFFSVIIVDAQQVSTAAKADLVDFLEGLREAMLKKINCDIDITAQAFTDVKDYWRSKRWADILTTPLRILEDTLSLLAKTADIKSLSKDANAALNNSETLYQVLSIVMMYQDLQKVGEKLYWGLNGPNYVVSIESMLEEADATFVPPFGDNWQKYYKKTIKNYLYGTTETIPLIIPRRSTTAERRNIEFAKGALQVRSRITRMFNDLIDEIKSTELPEDFPIDEVIIQVRGLTKQIHKSMSYNTDVEYKTNFQDHVKVKLGAVGEQYRAFTQIAGMVDKNLEIEQSIELLKFIESIGNAVLLYTITYKIPGAEEIKIAQKATVLSELIINPYKNTFYSDPEKVFYMLPQEMILSMPTELSNLWMIADDIDQYLRCFYQEVAKPIITSPLKITPSSPYYVGDKINAEFTITNQGMLPINLSILTVGGRDPDNQIADFTHRQNITLEPSKSYNYQGTLTLNKVGDYHFFCTYQTPDGDWDTSIDLGPGLTDKDRTEDIIVKEKEKPFSDINKTNIIHNLIKNTYYNTIQEALDDADSGNTIEVANGTYNESITFPSGKKLTLQSVNGASSTIIQGNDHCPTVVFNNSLPLTILEGFSITHVDGKIGGGVLVDGGNAIIKNCIICNNQGGGIDNYGTLTITGSTISHNSASRKGGGIYNAGKLTINESNISDNSTGRKGEIYNWGGGIFNWSGSLIIIKSTVSGNSAGHGGGIFIYNGSLTITESTVSGNSARYGGGIENQASLAIIKSTVSGNYGHYEGGGIDNSWSGTLIIIGNTISNNSAKRGGGIYIRYYPKTITIGGNSIDEKNTICGNYKSGEHPSLDQQISGVFVREDLYETNKDFNYKDFNTISVYCE